MALAPSTTKDTGNEMKIMKLEKTTKPISWWHMIIGVIVVVLAVILF